MGRNRNTVTELVRAEMRRQDEKWGFPQQNTALEWLAILTEEVGEVARAMLVENFSNKKSNPQEELIQVAAVAIQAAAWYEGNKIEQ